MRFSHLDVQFPSLNCMETDKGRFYETPEGNRYPSVTTVLGYETKDGIERWRERVGEKQAAKILENSQIIGTALHSTIEDYLNNKPIVIPENFFVKLCFTNMKRHLDKINNIHGQEASLYSDTLKLAGRTDCIAEYDGVLSIIDFKQSLKVKKEEWIPNYFMQGTAYSFMYEELFGIRIPQIVIIVGVHDGEVQVFRKPRKEFTQRLVNTNRRVQKLMGII